MCGNLVLAKRCYRNVSYRAQLKIDYKVIKKELITANKFSPLRFRLQDEIQDQPLNLYCTLELL